MATKMIGCPHCGTPNSERKRICHHCQQEMHMPALVQRAAVPQIRRVAAAPAPAARPTPRAPRFNMRYRAQFYRQLQAQLNAGIPTSICLINIKEGIAPVLRRMTQNLAEATNQGVMLSAAMARYPQVFTDWEISLVHAGEVAGTLPEAMGDIAEMLEAELNLRMMTGAKTLGLKFTAFVLALVICIVVRAKQVLPMLMQSEQQYSAAEVLVKFFLPALNVFVLIMAGFFVLLLCWRTLIAMPGVSRFLRPIIYRLPLIGPVMVGTVRFRFLSVLGTLWNAGVAPMEALETAARASDDPGLMRRIAGQLDAFGKGMPLGSLLAATRYFPSDVLYLVSTGETSGSVPEMLRTVSGYIRQDLENRLKSLPWKAQLLMYSVMVPIVGYLVVTTWKWVYDKMFEAVGG
ncbi:MAG: type II secretion system F family protein [Armatimonadota bacterium]